MTSLPEPLTTESRSLAVLAGPVLERLMDDLAETGITVRLTEGRPQIGADSAGTAVTDPRSGRVIGSVTLVGSSADDRDLMAILAQRTAREIEHLLLDGSGIWDRLTFGRFLKQRQGSDGAFVFLTDNTMLTNSAAARLVEPDDEAGMRISAARLRHPRSRGAVIMRLRAGTVTVRIEPTVDDGPPVGTILRLTTSSTRMSARDDRCSISSSGWDTLTETEDAVVALVAEGLTNRNAAKRLYMSHHTVGSHLRSIFVKLGVTSRVDLTRAVVERNGLVGDGVAVGGTA